MTARWFISRLRAMSIGEVVMRLGQAADKRLLPWHLKGLKRVRLGIDESSLKYPIIRKEHLENDEAFQESVCWEGKEIAEGRWALLHSLHIEGLEAPDWHYDYLAKQSCERDTPASRFNHRTLPNGQDPRIIWEINRWQHLVRLAQAAYIEQSAAKAKHVLRLLQDWQRANPVGIGINWTSSLEVGLRLLNLVWLDALIQATPDSRQEWGSLLRDLAVPHVWWAWKFRSPGSSANNHLLGELAGVLVAILRWPRLEEISVDHRKLMALLCDQIEKQFAGDGGNREHALHYHFFAWELCYHCLNAIEAAHYAIPSGIKERLQLAVQFWLELEGGDEAWDYGDSDDAIVVPVAGFGNPLAQWRAYFQGANSEISLWIKKPDWMRNNSGPRAQLPAGNELWSLFPESGYAVVKSGSVQVRLDGSPLGYLAGAGHGHLDALHLSVWYQGKAVVIDPGTGGYYANPQERAALADVRHHNGPFCPTADYPDRRGPFIWGNHHVDPILKCLGDRGVRCELTLNRGALLVSREVRVDCEDGLRIVVTDGAAGDVPQGFEVTWILAPGWVVANQDARSFEFVRAESLVRLVLGDGWQSIEIEQPDGGAKSGMLVSPSFRRFERSVAVRLKSKPEALKCRSEWIFNEL